MTLVFAHRGASHAYPENTLAAFAGAVAMGSDGVELDVRRTADNQLIIHHDPHLADGRIIRDTLAGDLPESIASFDDALDACDGLIVNIEIKNDPSEPDYDPDDWVAHRVAAELARRGHDQRWLVSSFWLPTVNRFRALRPMIRTAYLVYGPDTQAIEAAVSGGHHALHPWSEMLDEAAIRAAHAAGLAVNTWTCDDPVKISDFIAWGVDGICTNVPDIALEVRRSRR